jgi:hypothetical protein
MSKSIANKPTRTEKNSKKKGKKKEKKGHIQSLLTPPR